MDYNTKEELRIAREELKHWLKVRREKTAFDEHQDLSWQTIGQNIADIENQIEILERESSFQ